MSNWPKPGIVSAVYSPARADFPYLAVLFGPDGEVLAARSWPTEAAAEQFIAGMMTLFSAETGQPLTIP